MSLSNASRSFWKPVTVVLCWVLTYAPSSAPDAGASGPVGRASAAAGEGRIEAATRNTASAHTVRTSVTMNRLPTEHGLRSSAAAATALCGAWVPAVGEPMSKLEPCQPALSRAPECGSRSDPVGSCPSVARRRRGDGAQQAVGGLPDALPHVGWVEHLGRAPVLEDLGHEPAEGAVADGGEGGAVSQHGHIPPPLALVPRPCR